MEGWGSHAWLLRHDPDSVLCLAGLGLERHVCFHPQPSPHCVCRNLLEGTWLIFYLFIFCREQCNFILGGEGAFALQIESPWDSGIAEGSLVYQERLRQSGTCIAGMLPTSNTLDLDGLGHSVPCNSFHHSVLLCCMFSEHKTLGSRD